MFGRISEWRRTQRRARNLKAGRVRTRVAASGAAALALLLVCAGGAVIASHARQMAQLRDSVGGQGGQGAVALQAVLPGARLSVPAAAGVQLAGVDGGAVLTLAGMQAAPALHLDLCRQLLDPGRREMLPLRIGFHFGDVAEMARDQHGVSWRNIVLTGPGDMAMPKLDLRGRLSADFSQPLELRWVARQAPARWIGDLDGGKPNETGRADFGTEGWMVWGREAALRIQRRPSANCPQAGELVVHRYTLADVPVQKVMAVAFPAQGGSASTWLAPGSYTVPRDPAPGLEDEGLFLSLQSKGLIRLGDGGLAELAPPDLPAWLAAGDPGRAAELASWAPHGLDADSRKLLKRLYRMADGDFVRRQVAVFNSERRLLAWRVRPSSLQRDWQASVASAAALLAPGLPAAGQRLFSDLPQGWGPWTRVAGWPMTDGQAIARLAMPVSGADGRLELMLAGRLKTVHGARVVHEARPVCTGRACADPSAVSVLTLEPDSGARELVLEASPLALSDMGLPGDQAYRHLHVADGKLAWQAFTRQPAPRTGAPTLVQLADRNGQVLWQAEASTAPATAAGMGALLGLNAEHHASVAGMLARLPSPSMRHDAVLSIDLALQAASQQAVDCIGMRRGKLEGGHCIGGAAAPEGRRAGLVLIDAETGDILAAAGAGSGLASDANWSEVRDFDRLDPARSPLRLPALQHDGGAHRSPGSTFKVISALGLELAARNDPQLEALLAGMPLAAINRTAAQRGFAFRTEAPSYPADTRLAHVTNYRDQALDRRAEAGRFGLSQAITYSLNTWFAWSGELSDRSLFGKADGGVPDLQALDPGALDSVRPIVAMAHRLGFEQAMRLDGGLLPADFRWGQWDALQATPSHIDPVQSRHELRQMAIGLRMQATPLQMALVAGAVGQGHTIVPRMLLSLDGKPAQVGQGRPLGVRLDRIRAGMKGVVDSGTAAGAFRGGALAAVRAGLSGKTGTSPSMANGEEVATVWFMGWLEPGSVPGQAHRLAVAAFASHSDATGGEHAAPMAAAVLASLEKRGK